MGREGAEVGFVAYLWARGRDKEAVGYCGASLAAIVGSLGGAPEIDPRD